MARAAALLLIALSIPACGGRGRTGDREPEPLATSSAAPIAFLRAPGTEADPSTGIEPSKQLVVVDADGSNERTVRTPGYDVESFSWSPDGRRIVFAARPLADYRRTLFVTNADGSGLRALRKTPDHSPNPVWSPRGDTIAFDNHDDGYHAVWVVKADGMAARRLTPGFNFSDPVWSPDGTQIAYKDSYGTGKSWTYVMNADGSAKRLLTRIFTTEWTPAGITYRTERGIEFIDPAGSAASRPVVVPEEWEQYRFARDGTSVVLWGRIVPRGDFEVAVVSASGGALTRVTDNDRHDLAPSLSPDGKSLAFEAYSPPESGEEPEPPGDIYLINANGSGERNLTDSPEDESAPVWAPKP